MQIVIHSLTILVGRSWNMSEQNWFRTRMYRFFVGELHCSIKSSGLIYPYLFVVFVLFLFLFFLLLLELWRCSSDLFLSSSRTRTVPDWQPRNTKLLGVVEAWSVNVKKTTTTTYFNVKFGLLRRENALILVRKNYFAVAFKKDFSWRIHN